MKIPIANLVWDMHRAEGNAALTHGFRGEVMSLGEGCMRPVQTEEDVNAFNLGVQAGVKAMLDQLHYAGYVLTDPMGRHVRPETVKDKTFTFGESYARWHKPTPKLQVVDKE